MHQTLPLLPYPALSTLDKALNVACMSYEYQRGDDRCDQQLLVRVIEYINTDRQ